MIIDLYNTRDSKNTINKKLTGKSSFDVKFKDRVDITKPVLMLNSKSILLFNYAYIEKYKRYYFIDNIELYPNNIYYLYLTCDTLETYKDDILNSKGSITRQSNYNHYYNSGYDSEVRKEVDIIKSDITLDSSNKSTVLVTIGGVK